MKTVEDAEFIDEKEDEEDIEKDTAEGDIDDIYEGNEKLSDGVVGNCELKAFVDNKGVH